LHCRPSLHNDNSKVSNCPCSFVHSNSIRKFSLFVTARQFHSSESLCTFVTL
jgi:hypothetical protein